MLSDSVTFIPAEPGETLEGVAVASWADQAGTAEMFRVDVRTLANWRKLGLPSRRDSSGRRFYAFPHIVVWFDAYHAARRVDRPRVGRMPFAVAWARRQYENAWYETFPHSSGPPA